MKNKLKPLLSLELLLVFTVILFSGCTTSGSSSAQGMSPTVSGYISTSAVKNF